MWKILGGTGLVLGVVVGFSASRPETSSQANVTGFVAATTAGGGPVPTALIGVDPNLVVINTETTFSGEGSFDPDGFIQTYEWTVSNQDNPGGGPAVFTTPDPFTPFTPSAWGHYNVSLVTIDNDGNRSSPASATFVAVQVTSSTSSVNVTVGTSSSFSVSVLPSDTPVGFSIRSTTTATFVSSPTGAGSYNITVTGQAPGTAQFVIGTTLIDIVTVTVDVGDLALPEAITSTPTKAIAVGNSAILDGSQSYDHDDMGGSPGILQYMWHIVNLSDPTQAPIDIDAGNQAVITVPLDIPGEYEATLTVIDNDFQTSDPADSAVSVRVTAVSVEFSADPVTMDEGTSASVTATIYPDTAAALVAFSTGDGAVATVNPAGVLVTPAALAVSGVAAGSTNLVATVTNSLGTETCGSTGITVTVPIPPSFSVDTATFLSNRTGLSMTATVQKIPVGGTAVLVSDNPSVFGFGTGGSASVTVVNGANALAVRTGSAGIANLTLVVTRGAQVWNIGGVQITVNDPGIVITFDHPGPYAIDERVTVTARASGAPGNARIQLNVPSIGTVTGPASGTVVRGRLDRAGRITVTARLLNTANSTVRAEIVVVELRRINRPNRVVRLSNGVTPPVTFTPVTRPGGFGSMTRWSVVPSQGVTQTRNPDGSLTLQFTRPGNYRIRATIGSSTDTGRVIVQPARRGGP